MKGIKKSFGKLAILTSAALVGASASVALAQTSIPSGPITSKATLGAFLCNLINWFFWIILVISVIMVLVAAFDYVTAGDNTEKTTRGRKRLTYAAIGIAVALLAYGFPSIVASVFPNSPSATVSCSG